MRRSLRFTLWHLATVVALAVAHSVQANDNRYGDNANAGQYVSVNGIQMYFEQYGDGDPLVLIHGSGQSIVDMAAQISFFAQQYRVIVGDSRAHGKSGMSAEQMTYRQMASDWAALIDQLKLEPVKLIGWSDGGNISLELARAYPDKVDRLAVMGANLSPSREAVQDWAVDWVKDVSAEIEAKIAAGDDSRETRAMQQQFYLLRELPDMSVAELASIEAPVLVMAGDRDIIRDQHTVKMYQTLPNAHLAIFPGETHFTPATNPALFNTTVERFFANPYTRPDSKTFIFGDH